MKKRSLISFFVVGLFVSREACAETLIQLLMADKISQAVKNMDFSSVTLLMVIGAAFLAFSLLNMGSAVGESLGGASIGNTLGQSLANGAKTVVKGAVMLGAAALTAGAGAAAAGGAVAGGTAAGGAAGGAGGGAAMASAKGAGAPATFSVGDGGKGLAQNSGPSFSVGGEKKPDTLSVDGTDSVVKNAGPTISGGVSNTTKAAETASPVAQPVSNSNKKASSWKDSINKENLSKVGRGLEKGWDEMSDRAFGGVGDVSDNSAEEQLKKQEDDAWRTGLGGAGSFEDE